MSESVQSTSSASESKSHSRHWLVWPAAAVVAVASIAIFWGATRVSSGDSAASGDFGKFYNVTPIDLDIKVRKDGELQAVNNTDVLCQVEGRSTIVYLVKEGEPVKKGDLLVELDSSTLRQSLET